MVELTERNQTNDGLHCSVCKKQLPNRDLVIVDNKFVCITCVGVHE